MNELSLSSEVQVLFALPGYAVDGRIVAIAAGVMCNRPAAFTHQVFGQQAVALGKILWSCGDVTARRRYLRTRKRPGAIFTKEPCAARERTRIRHCSHAVRAAGSGKYGKTTGAYGTRKKTVHGARIQGCDVDRVGGESLRTELVLGAPQVEPQRAVLRSVVDLVLTDGRIHLEQVVAGVPLAASV